MMLENNILLKYFDQTASAEEILMVDTWVKASFENKKHFEEMRTIYQESNQLQSFKSSDLNQEWQNFVSDKIEHHKPIESAFSYRRIMVYASAACFALICAFYFLLRNPTVTISSDSQTLSYQLPDKSHVELAPSSSISFKKKWANEEARIVKLQGKAQFDVSVQNGQEFIVESDYFSTKVLGTVFIVDVANPDFQEVIVKHGKVGVQSNNASSMRLLNTGDSVSFKNGSFGAISKGNDPLTSESSQLEENEKVKDSAAEKESPKVTYPSLDVEKPIKIEQQENDELAIPAGAPLESPVELSKYELNTVLDYLDSKHQEHELFSISKKAKVKDGDIVELNLAESIPQILERLEKTHNLDYGDPKCENCLDLKRIKKK